MKHAPKIIKIFIISIALSLLLINLVFASTGDLDTTFDGDGIAEVAFSGNPAVFSDIITQPDEKIIAVGYKDQNTDWAAPFDVLIARFLEDGSLDPTFGTSGIYTASINGADGRFYAAALQSDGKIVVVGYSVSGGKKAFLVTRFTADGALDTTFGSSGITTSSFGAGDDVAYDVAIQEDGKIVVAGSAESSSYSFMYDFVVTRYTDAGVLDSTFNSTGYTIVPLKSDARDYAKNVAIQSDGKIVAVGPVETGNFTNTFNVATIRLTTAGVLDTTFNSTGIASYYGSGGAENCGGLGIQNDGKIVVAANINSGSDIGAIRYTTAGVMDTEFSLADFGSTDIVQDAVLQTDGKFVVTGYKYDASNIYDPFVVRYNIDGTKDTTFSGDGLAFTIIGTDTDYGHSVAVQPDGQILVGGYKASGGYAAILLRYDTRVTGTATVGTSETPIGSTNVSAQVPSGSCEVTAIKKNAFPGGSADDGEMPVVWDITGTGCSFPMTLEFCYSDAELANAMNVTESSLVVFKYNDGSGSWVSQGGTVSTGSNCVTLTGVSALSDWTLGDTTTSGNSGPTAIALDSFRSQPMQIVPWLLGCSAAALLLWALSRRLSRA